MPRGLGDDPLSKQRKNGSRKTPAPGLSSSTVASPYDSPSVKAPVEIEPLSEAASFPSLSPTYNDIFFQRRPERPEDIPPTVSPTTGPSAVESMARSSESTQIPNPTDVTTPTPTDFPRLQDEKDAAMSQPLVTNGVSPDIKEKKLEEPEGRGFFKRIFGKLKSH